MRLTLHSDYALRLMMLLAVEDDKLHTIESVADRYNISYNHLMKVAQKLAQSGYVESVRGRGGGLKLARETVEINIGQIVRMTEDNFNIVECFDKDKNTCQLASFCTLRMTLHEAFSAFIKVLDQYSLHDLVSKPHMYKGMQRALFASE